MRLEYKTVGVASVQKVEDEGGGIVTAFVSVTGLKDNVNDIIEPGAYAETLSKRVPKGVWGHQWIQPTSKTLEAVELMPGDSRLPAILGNGDPWPAEAGALRIKTRFNLNTQRGRDAYEDVVFFGDEQEWSIGYVVPTGGATIDKKTGVRRIKRLELYEYSPVLFGAMPMARTSSVKTAQLALKTLLGEDVARWERQFAELKAGVEAADGDRADDTGADFDGDVDAGEVDTNAEGDDAGPDVSADTSDQASGMLDPETIRAAIKALESVLTGMGAEPASADVDVDTEVDAVRGDIEAKATEYLTVKAAIDALDVDLDRPDLLALQTAAAAIDGAYQSDDLAGVEAAGTDMLDVLERVIDDSGITDGMRVVSRMIADRIEDLETGEDQDPATEATEAARVEAKGAPVHRPTAIKNYGTGGEHTGQRSTDEIAQLGKRGMAFRNSNGDWCYPIETVDDLTNAIQAFGRSKPEDRDRLRTYVKKRARAMRRDDLIPDAWSGKTQVLDLAELKALETFAAGLQPPSPP